MDKDIAEMARLRNGEASALDDVSTEVPPSFFVENRFIASTVNTKTFVLMLAQRSPRSFISGSEVNLKDVLQNYNRNEFHHVYPEAFLKGVGGFSSKQIYALANFVFMKRVENRELGGTAPSVYVAKMPGNKDEILRAALVPPTFTSDDYAAFLNQRSGVLASYALDLTEQSSAGKGGG